MTSDLSQQWFLRVNHGCRFMTQLTFDKKAGGLLAHCEWEGWSYIYIWAHNYAGGLILRQFSFWRSHGAPVACAVQCGTAPGCRPVESDGSPLAWCDGGKWDVYARNHQFIIYKHGKNDINIYKNDVKSFILPCLWDLNDFKSSTNSRFMAIYHILWDTIQVYKHEDLTKETVAIIISPSCLTSSPYSWKSWNNTSQPEHISMYPPVNKHRPWQIGVGRLVSTKNWWFSGAMLITRWYFPY
jgi:hypothetical protein